MSMGFEEAVTEIWSVDSQYSQGEGVMVMVTGSLQCKVLELFKQSRFPCAVDQYRRESCPCRARSAAHLCSASSWRCRRRATMCSTTPSGTPVTIGHPSPSRPTRARMALGPSLVPQCPSATRACTHRYAGRREHSLASSELAEKLLDFAG